MPHRDERGSIIFRALGFVAIFAVLGGILVPVVALSFSVRIQGESMAPTFTEGDRVFVDVSGRNDVARFDIIEAEFEGLDTKIVKRVIGLPGDKVSVLPVDGDSPVVWIRAAGSTDVRVVSNPAWDGQVGTSVSPCCGTDGKLTKSGKERWVTVPPDSYWIIGDNWGGSHDSRIYGFVKETAITGRVLFRLTPLSSFGALPTEVTLEPAKG